MDTVTTTKNKHLTNVDQRLEFALLYPYTTNLNLINTLMRT